MQDQLIIQTEYFLQCAGSCSGCFLTPPERQSLQTHHDAIAQGLERALVAGKKSLVVGFGRGNLLALSYPALDQLGALIAQTHKKALSASCIFEVSTSLIGKIDAQIERALHLLDYSSHIYFNVVVNSEITSPTFWRHLKQFFDALEHKRQSWGWSDHTGDILVLNVNPDFLPDLSALMAMNLRSPINISLFPFDPQQTLIQPGQLLKLKEWTLTASQRLQASDFNVSNHLAQYDFEFQGLADVVEHTRKTGSTYLFIDKTGHITQGLPSVMGEIDTPRLMARYGINADVVQGFKLMQRTRPCSSCPHQYPCLATGAYLNLLANQPRLSSCHEPLSCPSGYREFFNQFLPAP